MNNNESPAARPFAIGAFVALDDAPHSIYVVKAYLPNSSALGMNQVLVENHYTRRTRRVHVDSLRARI